jgi:hypothetical protein
MGRGSGEDGAVIDWFFRNRRTGERTVFQAPNLSLATFVVARLVLWIVRPEGDARTAVDAVGTAALVWWAGDEVLRGVNPFRRLLGAGVLTGVLVDLLSPGGG